MFLNKIRGDKINNTNTDISEYLESINEKPTEEWGGLETRTFANYARPISNLFDNDRELNSFVNSILKGLTRGEIGNKVLYGGKFKEPAGGVYELEETVFVNQGEIYHIYPNVKAACALLGINPDLVTYKEGEYHVKTGETTIEVKNTFAEVAARLLDDPVEKAVLKTCGIPIYDSKMNLYFDKGTKKLVSGAAVDSATPADTQIIAISLDGDTVNLWEGFTTDSYKKNSITNDKLADTIEKGRVKGSTINDTDITDLDQTDLRDIIECVHLEGPQDIEGEKTFKNNIFCDENVYAQNCYSKSSIKYKKDVSNFNLDATNLIDKVNVVNYHYKTDEEGLNDKVGFIAEDTPTLFSTKEMDKMDMSNCIGLLLKANQELNERITELEKLVK